MGFKKHIFGAILVFAAVITAISGSSMGQKVLIVAVCLISAALIESMPDKIDDKDEDQ